MVLRLAEQPDVPQRERSALLGAAGYAPLFAERPPAGAATAEALRALAAG